MGKSDKKLLVLPHCPSSTACCQQGDMGSDVMGLLSNPLPWAGQSCSVSPAERCWGKCAMRGSVLDTEKVQGRGMVSGTVWWGPSSWVLHTAWTEGLSHRDKPWGKYRCVCQERWGAMKKAKHHKKCCAKRNPGSIQCRWTKSLWLQWGEDFTQGLRGATRNYRDNSGQTEMESPAQGCQLRAFTDGHDRCHNHLVILYFVAPVIIWKSMHWHVKKKNMLNGTLE